MIEIIVWLLKGWILSFLEVSTHTSDQFPKYLNKQEFLILIYVICQRIAASPLNSIVDH